MRHIIERLEEKYESIKMNRKKSKEIERYSDKYRTAEELPWTLVPMINRTKEYPEELVRLGFGYGVKCKTKGAEIKSMDMEEIGSEVEESEETSEEKESSEENDYIETYYDDDEKESEDDIEDYM